MTSTAWLPTVQQIKDAHQAKPVANGELTASGRPSKTTIDATTANMLIAVHDALNETNQEKFAALPLLKAINVGWKLASA